MALLSPRLCCSTGRRSGRCRRVPPTLECDRVVQVTDPSPRHELRVGWEAREGRRELASIDTECEGARIVIQMHRDRRVAVAETTHTGQVTQLPSVITKDDLVFSTRIALRWVDRGYNPGAKGGRSGQQGAAADGTALRTDAPRAEPSRVANPDINARCRLQRRDSKSPSDGRM